MESVGIRLPHKIKCLPGFFIIFVYNVRQSSGVNMNTFGNILWLVLGGLLVSLMYFLSGLLMCVTIIGIPFGVQLWKLGTLALFPFGKDVSFSSDPGCLTIVFNIIWVVCNWWEIALVHLVFGLLCGITIIGIPFAKQHFKLMKMSFLPFGMTIN